MERAPRFNRSSKEISVGPGNYNPDLPTFKPATGSAPFGSTSFRRSSSTFGQTPGPGAYEVRSSSARSISFPSQTRFRTQTEIQETPGPGEYEVREARRIQNDSVVPHAPSIQWLKISTAPSIPDSRQSFGYDQRSGGDLVQINPPVTGHIGSCNDSAGPGEYNPSYSLVRKGVSATSFAKGSGRGGTTVTNVPGPGEYDPPLVSDVSRGGVAANKPLSSFASAVERGMTSKNGIEPSPGSYEVPQTFCSKQKYLASHPQSFMSFGRTLVDEQVEKPTLGPGPGAYDPQVPKVHQSRGPTAAFALQSHHYDHVESELIPGPGAYDAAIGFSEKLKRRVHGRFGVFGSTSQRFSVEVSDRNNQTACPPSDVGSSQRQARRPIRSHAKTRFVTTASIPSIPPEITPSHDERVISREWPKPSTTSQSFLSSAPRFHKQTAQATPGPGHYNSSLSKSIASPLIGGKSNRFTAGHEDETPGPGTYETLKPLLKRTFNITIGAEEGH